MAIVSNSPIKAVVQRIKKKKVAYHKNFTNLFPLEIVLLVFRFPFFDIYLQKSLVL